MLPVTGKPGTSTQKCRGSPREFDDWMKVSSGIGAPTPSSGTPTTDQSCCSTPGGSRGSAGAGGLAFCGGGVTAAHTCRADAPAVQVLNVIGRRYQSSVGVRLPASSAFVATVRHLVASMAG